jgi:RNA polymerase sigma factor (sigma-70 family)
MTHHPNFGLSDSECGRLQKGDKLLQSKIFGKYMLSFVNLAKSKWGVSVEDAEDIVSGAFSKLFCKMQSGTYESDNMSGYVYRIIERESWKYVEKYKSDIVETKETLPNVLAVEEKVPDNPFLEKLDKAFNQLGTKCQQLLKDFYWEDLDHDDIALALGISNDASRQRKRECINKLRQIMGVKMPLRT